MLNALRRKLFDLIECNFISTQMSFWAKSFEALVQPSNAFVAAGGDNLFSSARWLFSKSFRNCKHVNLTKSNFRLQNFFLPWSGIWAKIFRNFQTGFENCKNLPRWFQSTAPLHKDSLILESQRHFQSLCLSYFCLFFLTQPLLVLLQWLSDSAHMRIIGPQVESTPALGRAFQH